MRRYYTPNLDLEVDAEATAKMRAVLTVLRDRAGGVQVRPVFGDRLEHAAYEVSYYGDGRAAVVTVPLEQVTLLTAPLLAAEIDAKLDAVLAP